jgi:hypothetical protein
MVQDASAFESTPVPIRRAHQFYGAAVTDSPRSGSPRSGNWLLKLALTLFTAGLLAIIAIFVSALVSDDEPALWLYLAAMLAPAGFLLAVAFALWSGRRAR